MKPVTQNFQRTTGDTDRVVVVLTVDDGETTAAVADGATVKLHVTGLAAITGTAKGDSSGTFYFSGATLATVSAGVYPYEVQVSDGTYIYTILRGKITFTAEIL